MATGLLWMAAWFGLATAAVTALSHAKRAGQRRVRREIRHLEHTINNPAVRAMYRNPREEKP